MMQETNPILKPTCTELAVLVDLAVSEFPSVWFMMNIAGRR